MPAQLTWVLQVPACISHSIESLKSGLALRALGWWWWWGGGWKFVQPYWDSSWGLFAFIPFPLVSSIPPQIRLNGLFVSSVISVASEWTPIRRSRADLEQRQAQQRCSHAAVRTFKAACPDSVECHGNIQLHKFNLCLIKPRLCNVWRRNSTEVFVIVWTQKVLHDVLVAKTTCVNEPPT